MNCNRSRWRWLCGRNWIHCRFNDDFSFIQIRCIQHRIHIVNHSDSRFFKSAFFRNWCFISIRWWWSSSFFIHRFLPIIAFFVFFLWGSISLHLLHRHSMNTDPFDLSFVLMQRHWVSMPSTNMVDAHCVLLWMMALSLWSWLESAIYAHRHSQSDEVIKHCPYWVRLWDVWLSADVQRSGSKENIESKVSCPRWLHSLSLNGIWFVSTPNEWLFRSWYVMRWSHKMGWFKWISST